MSFLTSVKVPKMMVLMGSRLLKLTSPQMHEIIKYQNKMPYNKHWLIADRIHPYFKLSKNHKQIIVYLDKDVFL